MSITKSIVSWALVLYLLCYFSGMTFAGIGDWKTLTNMNDIRAIAISEGNLFCATNGGIFKLNLQDGSYSPYTNTEGLVSNDVRTVEVDRNGDVWFGMVNGKINLWHVGTMTWEVIDDYQGHLINDLAATGDSMFVALDIGVSLYTISRREVKETYKSLGKNFEVEINANAIYIKDRDLWVATNSGIAQSNFDKINLLDPENWVNYTVSQGLPSNRVNALASFGDMIYAGTSGGVARFFGNQWQSFNSGLDTDGSRNIKCFLAYGDTLYMGTADGVYKLGASENWVRMGGSFFNVASLATDGQGGIWAGRQQAGLAYFLPDENKWETIVPPGPASNIFVDMAVDQKGLLWCASTDAGILYFDGQNWGNISTSEGLKHPDLRAVAVDQRNRKWFGSWGGGVTVIDEEGQFQFFTRDHLAGIVKDPNYFVVNDIAVDDSGNVWMLNAYAANGNALVAVTPDFQWVYFSTSPQGLKTNWVTTLAIDRLNRVWVGTENRGLSVLDYKGTLLNTNDDDFSQGLTKEEGLLSTKVTALVEDQDGVMWIGTDQGLNFWYGGKVDTVWGLINNEVQTILVDIRNNKWIGTRGGITVLHADGYTMTHYTTDNSPLVNNIINSFAHNDNTGDFFIGTALGLSRLETGYTRPASTLDSLSVFPNPFILSATGRELTIHKLAHNSQVRIFTINGVLVKNIPESEVLGGQAFWDGRNDRGEWVASGIYLIFAYTESGLSKVGKVAVIRK